MNDIKKLLKTRSYLTRKLLLYREMLPGSFIERKITCGKKNCTCHINKELHTAYQLSYREDNKTISKMIPAESVDQVRKQIDQQKRFNSIVKKIQMINIQILLTTLQENRNNK